MFADRSSNRIFAPEITAMRGSQAQEQVSEEMLKKVIKDNIWELYQRAQKYLSCGYCSMLIRKQDFQYSYRLWFEDSQGQEVPLEIQPFQQQGPLGHLYYKDLLKKVPKAVKCFELYCVYLAHVPSKLISVYEQRLIGKCKESIL